jgi:hypothetical protein
MKQLSNDDRNINWEDRFKSIVLLIIGVALALAIAFNGWVTLYHSQPHVVVMLDKDAKATALLAIPPEKVLTGDRAALWFTVFNKACQYSAASDARYYANDAVDHVYGPVPKPQPK